jgi:VWFA-related protein
MRLLGLLLVIAISVNSASAQKVPEELHSLDVQVFGADESVVQSLTQADFSLYENGQPLEIRGFETVGTPFSILLLVDRSRAMENDWVFLEPAIQRFLSGLRPQDRVAIAAFNDKPDMLMEWRSVREGRQIQVDLRPDRVRPGGASVITLTPPSDGLPEITRSVSYSVKPVETDFYGALSWAEKQFQGIRSRKGIIVFSSGIQPLPPTKQFHILNSADDRDFQKILRTISQGEVPLYFLTLDTDLNPRRSFATLDFWNPQQMRSRLQQLGEASGGSDAYPRNPDEVASLYEQIARELGTAYTLTFEAARKDSRIEVRVRGNLRVRKASPLSTPAKTTVE